ncbi:MAG: hypothetical protein HOK41_01845 [Nitrospina sp.]|jgi:hypothetical protein|nr:hypothetical protein [Nitrospinaceae bacterium]MBT5469322.1 hypothetical protein [Nitrospina sp.]
MFPDVFDKINVIATTREDPQRHGLGEKRTFLWSEDEDPRRVEKIPLSSGYKTLKKLYGISESTGLDGLFDPVTAR